MLINRLEKLYGCMHVRVYIYIYIYIYGRLGGEGVSPTGKSLRFIRAHTRSGCRVESGLKLKGSPFPFSLSARKHEQDYECMQLECMMPALSDSCTLCFMLPLETRRGSGD